MKNITRLKCWPDLMALGFIRINYNFNGRLFSVGASLQDDRGSDLITIEPSSAGRFYHISGRVNTPFIEEVYRYDYSGRKEKFYQRCEFINEHCTGRELPAIVKKMML